MAFPWHCWLRTSVVCWLLRHSFYRAVLTGPLLHFLVDMLNFVLVYGHLWNSWSVINFQNHQIICWGQIIRYLFCSPGYFPRDWNKSSINFDDFHHRWWVVCGTPRSMLQPASSYGNRFELFLNKGLKKYFILFVHHI